MGGWTKQGWMLHWELHTSAVMGTGRGNAHVCSSTPFCTITIRDRLGTNCLENM